MTQQRQEKERLYKIIDSSFEPFTKKDKVVLLDIDGDFKNGFIVTLNELLWHQTWDILYFAGHSSSSNNDEVGYISTSAGKLTITDLKHALSNAISNGLKLAIFNSCDGMGLASSLANLHIPQLIVMREWVPDEVAQEFLTNFLKAFVGGKSLYQSVRDA